VYAAVDENCRPAAVDAVIAAGARGLLDEFPDLARIRLDTRDFRRNIPLLLIGKTRMQVCHYHIVACDAYNGCMPQHCVLVCWASRSTSLWQVAAGFVQRETRTVLQYLRRLFEGSVLVRPSIGKKPKVMERGSSEQQRRLPPSAHAA
jgi:hypothetical protein